MSKRYIAALDLPDPVSDWPGGAKAYLEHALPEIMQHMLVSVVPVEEEYEVVPRLELRKLVRMALREIEPDDWPAEVYDEQDRDTVHHWALGVLDPDELHVDEEA